MSEIQVQTYNGGTTQLKPRAVDEFRSGLRGKLITASDPEYNTARQVWNAMIDRKPALIARCLNAEDVAYAVRFARSHDMLLSVRGGGHNIAGHAICNDGLVIDLSQMNQVVIDGENRTARVGPGATLGQVDRVSQTYALATPLGINSTTGVAGLTLGGGFGWLSRKHGLTIDNLLSADVITANGDLLEASSSQNPDLFWAIRGGGGNFGIVTSFEYRLHQLGPDVLAGLIIHPIEDAPAVLRFYRDFIQNTPEEFVCWFVLRKAPPLPFLDPAWHGREILALAVCYSGQISDGERVARPLRSFGKPLADVIGPTPYADWQTVLDPLLTPGLRNYWKTHDFRKVSDGLLDVLLGFARRIPDPMTEIAFAQLGGAVSRVRKQDTAYTHRDAEFVLNVHGRWSDPNKDAACVSWARELYQAAAPFATGGAYVNFLTQDEQERVRAAYGDNYGRLTQVKTKYDPENVFRLNPNILPKE